jgi:hypothetical protein
MYADNPGKVNLGYNCRWGLANTFLHGGINKYLREKGPELGYVKLLHFAEIRGGDV